MTDLEMWVPAQLLYSPTLLRPDIAIWCAETLEGGVRIRIDWIDEPTRGNAYLGFESEKDLMAFRMMYLCTY